MVRKYVVKIIALFKTIYYLHKCSLDCDLRQSMLPIYTSKWWWCRAVLYGRMDIIFLLSLASGLIVVICIVALIKQRTVKGIVINVNQHSNRPITIKSQCKVKKSHNMKKYWGTCMWDRSTGSNVRSGRIAKDICVRVNILSVMEIILNSVTYPRILW